MKFRTYSFICLFCGLLVTTPVFARHAHPPAAPVDKGPQDAISTVDDAGAITLKSGSGAVLEGVIYPQPLRAKAWLTEHAGQNFTYKNLGTDRYGRMRIVATLNGQTLQQAMLQNGAALVFDRDELPDSSWLKDEETARAKKLGIWDDPDLVLDSDRALHFSKDFHLVEGVVRHVYNAREATYLNFGDDWKTDFSVEIPKGARRNFGDGLADIEGKKVRVRGVLFEENGPMILINRPEQLEMLSHEKK